MWTGKALKDADSSDYVPIYEDKDGDWMLVGDVPWESSSQPCVLDENRRPIIP